jgi:hypothetical protein
MSRKILFQSGSPVQQLNRIVDLLGTPSLQDLSDAKASKGAVSYLLSKPNKPVSMSRILSLVHPFNCPPFVVVLWRHNIKYYTLYVHSSFVLSGTSSSRHSCFWNLDLYFIFQHNLASLYNLSHLATHESVHLLCRMLVFNPVSIYFS